LREAHIVASSGNGIHPISLVEDGTSNWLFGFNSSGFHRLYSIHSSNRRINSRVRVFLFSATPARI
jgi:hypothetical protein